MDELQQVVQRMLDAGESEENIAAVIAGWEENTAAPNVFSQSGTQSAAQGVGGFLGRLKDVAKGVIPGAIEAAKNPLQTLKNLHESQMQQFDKAGERFATGRTSEGIGHGVAGLIPFLGPAAATVGEGIGTGDPSQIGSGVADAALMAIPSPGLRGIAKGVGKAGMAPVNAAVRGATGLFENNPALAALGGGALGYATGGIPGAITGAAGGGIAGNLSRLTSKLAKRESPPHVPSAKGYDRYAANKGSSGGGSAKVAPGEASESIRALEPEIERYAPNTSSAPPRLRNTEDELLEGVESSPLSYLDHQHEKFMQPESLSSLDDVIAEHQATLGRVPQGRTPTAMDDFPKMARDRIDPDLLAEAQQFRKGFGFKKLPKISRAENDRIMANIRRARGQQ